MKGEIILGILLVILTILLIYTIIYYKEYISKIKLDKYLTFEKEFEDKAQLEISAYNEKIKDLKSKQNQLQSQLIETNSKLSWTNRELQLKEQTFLQLKNQKEEDLKRMIELTKERSLLILKNDIAEWSASAQEAAAFDFETYITEFENKKQELEEYKNSLLKEVEKIKLELDEYKNKQDTVNKEILRARAIEEQRDFYSIHIDENSKHDLEILNAVRHRLFKFDTLNKILYDNYISRPTKEMIKRVLEGKNPTGIYRVTNIKTNESYIGKSTSIGDRWQKHIKAAYGLDGVADSQFQRALKKYGIENFTWELLETTTKDKLTEREKYYIQLYNTVEYGYNMRVG